MQYPLHNPLPGEVRDEMAAMLNRLVANTADLASQVKQAHVNVKGAQFIALHEMYGGFYDDLNGYVDTLAERVAQFGGLAYCTVRQAAAESRLPEYPPTAYGSLGSVQALTDRYVIMLRMVLEAVEQVNRAGDVGTVELLIGMVLALDKALWQLEAHLVG